MATLGNDIMPQPMLTQQCHHQQDSAAMSHHEQCRLGNAIASITQQRHHAMTSMTW
jgi:hypothetical protein